MINSVFAAFVLLATVIAATPLIAFVGSPLIPGVIAALAATALATAAHSIPRGEGLHLSKLVRPIFFCLALPAIWIVIQMAPMPLQNVSNPIWASAEAALGMPMTGSISIDSGAGLVALGRYLSMVGIGVAAAAVSIDRRRAQTILFLLVGVTSVCATILLARTLLGLSLASQAHPLEISRSLLAGCILGVPVAAATCGHMLERYERRRTNEDMPFVRFALALVASLVALFVCSTAVVFEGSILLLSIAGCGFATVVGVATIRRFVAARRFILAAAATAIVALAVIIGVRGAPRGDLTLRYANASTRSVAIADAMMDDASWLGSGAGAYPALSPFYQQAGDATKDLSAPTTAAEIAIDLGKPALWALMSMGVLAIVYLIRGALIRGRDSFFPLAAAGAMVIFSLQSFYEASGFLTSTGVVISAIFGLGVAQSMSRSIQ